MNQLLRLATSFFFFSFLWFLLVYFNFGIETQSSKWVNDVYIKKESIANNIEKQKIVIVSGSNSLFGFNSKKIEEEFGIPVINSAVHAGLGMKYILYKSKNIIKEGDIVLLPLEYSFYQNNGKPKATYTDYIMSHDMDHFKYLSYKEKIDFILSVSFRRLYNGLRGKPLTPTVGLYSVQNINNHGDQKNTNKEQMTKKNISKVNKLKVDNIHNKNLSNSFKSAMGEYINWAKNKNICLIFMPPNHLYFEKYKDDLYVDFLHNIEKYYSTREMHFIGEWFDYMYSHEYYFDTSYHLNKNGVEKRTLQAIEDIGNISSYCKII